MLALVFTTSSFHHNFSGSFLEVLALIRFSWQDGGTYGGEVRTLEQLLTNKPESLEETLIAPKLTKIEFPQALRKISASSVVVMNDWWRRAEWVNAMVVWLSIHRHITQSLVVTSVPLKSWRIVYVAEFVPPVVILSTISQSPITMPWPVEPLQRGEQRSPSERKIQKKLKRSKRSTCLWTVQHNSPRTGKQQLFSRPPRFVLIRTKSRRTFKLEAAGFLWQVFHLRSHQSNFPGLPLTSTTPSHPFVPPA